MPKPSMHAETERAFDDRAGFTLLEVMLALTLSVLILGAVGAAVQIHLRAVETGRIEIEQAQLARAVLDRIADDLRGSLQHTAVDTSQLKLMAAASKAASGDPAALAAAAGALGGSTGGATGAASANGGSTQTGATSGTSALGQTSGQTSSGSTKGGSGTSSGGSTKSGSSGSSSSGASGSSGSGASSGSSGGGSTGSGSSTGSTDSSSAAGGSTTPAALPGLYGSASQVQVDVSRLPRPDEYGAAPAIADGAGASATTSAGVLPMAVPHDVRTVTYYLSSQTQSSSNLTSTSGGLMRRELNRAAAVWGSQQGVEAEGDAHSVSLAPEVTALEFRYLDAGEWVSDWDTAAKGCLPSAVEVAITIGTPAASGASATAITAPSSTTAQQPSELVVRRVIFLPAAGTPQVTTSAASSDPSASGDPSAASGSGASSSGSPGSSGASGS